MSLRIIFLDFDGPIRTLRSHLAYHGRGGIYRDPDPVAQHALLRLCEKAGVRIVLSAGDRFRADDVRQVLTLPDGRSLAVFLHPDSTVKSLAHDPRRPKDWYSRPWEIEEWLERHPEITDYRIVDDDMWDLPAHHRSKWARCHCHEGMPFRTILDLYEWAAIDNPSS